MGTLFFYAANCTGSGPPRYTLARGALTNMSKPADAGCCSMPTLVDVDHDGTVSLEEFRALLRAAGTLSEAEYAEACAQPVASPSPAAQQADAGSLQDTLVGRPRSRM